jgi:tRNA pseudouridine55 synthase
MARAKRALGSLKAGHTGTLDPFATGLLPVVFGEATKFSRFLIDAAKAYEATLRLGERTSTGDTESAVIERRAVACGDADIERVLAAFRGVQDQIPPMHSAVRVEGRRLYDYARAGQEVARAARSIEVGDLVRLSREGDELRLRVACSKGTYVRTLGEDIGQALGCGAHLVGLRRVGVGGFDIAQAVGLEALEAESVDRARERLLPVEVLVRGLDRLEAGEGEAQRFRNGVALDFAPGIGPEVAVFGPGGAFLGVGARQPDGRVAPLRLIDTSGAKLPDFA